jgi:predicted dehydrogenase
MAQLRLEGMRGTSSVGWSRFEPLVVPDAYRRVPADLGEGPVFNVAQLYAWIADDLGAGTSLAPDFALALRRHELLDAIERAAETGQRQLL